MDAPYQQHTPPRQVLHQYHRQLVTSRVTSFHKHNLQVLGHTTAPEDVEARRLEVIKRVARELWTNFVARGEETAMLRHLCDTLRKEYDADFQFTYAVGGFELAIARKVDEAYVPVTTSERIEITNRAWHLAMEIIAEFTLK